jgi:hypothetical protein
MMLWHTRNALLEGQCVYMVLRLHQVVDKQRRIQRLKKSNSSAMEDGVVANDKL